MHLTLAWRGPVGPGKFPEDADALEALDAPGVYLRVKAYERGNLVAYVGQSAHLLGRFDQHLVRTLGLTYPLRDDAGRAAYGGGLLERMASFNALEETAQRALREAARTKFYYALSEDGFERDYMAAIERLLIDRVRDRVGAYLEAAENKATPLASGVDLEVRIESDFSSLNTSDAATLAKLIGEEPICVQPFEALDVAYDA